LVRAGRAVARAAARLAGAPADRFPPRPVFWALRGFDLDVAPGERVGVIGPNGAGKTTALRLMGRITVPSRGRVRVRGKVGALIAVGAGIHPELSGRENIFLYGSIMGLKRREIKAKFDAIVSFAGIEEFLDTPVKYYSSGMRVRLGFSVAVHVDPEIMLVDEVLAVGDYVFQRRCLEKISEMADAGCTIVFVSHDLNSVTRLCTRAVFLNHGEAVFDGPSQQAVNCYLDQVREGGAAKGGATPTGEGVRFGSFEATIEAVRLLDRQGRPLQNLESGDPLVVEIRYHAHQAISEPAFGLDIRRSDDLLVFGALSSWGGLSLDRIEGHGTVRAVIERAGLAPGTYRLSVSLGDKTSMTFYDFHAGAYRLEVTASRSIPGVVQLPCHWEEGTAAAHPAARSAERES
jgi:lipopolysaccharide transport system ATP-binding protein